MDQTSHADQPSLVVNDLKLGRVCGKVALWSVGFLGWLAESVDGYGCSGSSTKFRLGLGSDDLPGFGDVGEEFFV